MIRFLEFQPPGARRHTWTAGTAQTSLHGLLDVAIHTVRTVLKKNPNVKVILIQSQISDSGKSKARWDEGTGVVAIWSDFAV
jgi:hypothetical protein